MKGKLIYIIPLLLGTIILKEMTRFLTVENIYFVLYPIQKIVYLFTNFSFEWIPSLGFKNSESNIIIDKSCSGISFMLVSCSLLFVLLVFNKNKWILRFKYIVISILISYFLTIVVNSFRIILAIKLIPFEKGFPLLSTATFHQLLGGTIYLFSLLVFYYLINSKIKTI